MFAGQILRQPGLVTALCGVLAITMILVLSRRLRGTTLRAALAWAVVAVFAIGAVEILHACGMSRGSGARITLRYVAAITTCCPIVAVLGAKRPQHGAWQLIVLSLWCVLALPAAESHFVRRGAAVQIHDARGWFLWILLLTGCLNYVGTRHGLSALLACSGQMVLLGEHLPVWRRPVTATGVALAMTLFLIATLLVLLRSDQRVHWWRDKSSRDPDDSWSDFRNLYGTFWALRISERFNMQAKLNDWPVELGYHGFRLAAASGGKLADEPRQFLTSLLSRFVPSD